MCWFCGCGMGGGFESVKVILPSEINILPGDKKENAPAAGIQKKMRRAG